LRDLETEQEKVDYSLPREPKVILAIMLITLVALTFSLLWMSDTYRTNANDFYERSQVEDLPSELVALYLGWMLDYDAMADVLAVAACTDVYLSLSGFTFDKPL